MTHTSPGASGAHPVGQVRWGMVVHGGAGTIARARMTPEIEALYREKMTEVLETGQRVLADGGSALDAVQHAVRVFEDSPLFNAGRGAAFAHDGSNRLDAAIMDGATLRAGAVAGVMHVKNPIDLARAVMEHTTHVLISGSGAEAFAREQGIALAPDSYFYTDRRWRQLQEAQRAGPRDPGVITEGSLAGAGAELERGGEAEAEAEAEADERRFGTVGAVALDRDGRIAVGTSTGGLTDKRWGRIGDSPLIGCGTYANTQCGVSATGAGEFFIRSVVAHDVAARMAYQRVSLAQAAHDVVHGELVERGGQGGIVALDAGGHVVWPFNSEGMYRGYIGEAGEPVVRIYRDEERDAAR